jgi:23S rRNA pseudouridine955/2504/2580 synthase
MTLISKTSTQLPIQTTCIDEAHEGQRLDNFLVFFLKGVPKSHIYRIIRSGEIRINKKRAKADTRLSLGDLIRIPPIRMGVTQEADKPFIPGVEFPIIFEDDYLLVINKPAGVAVHGGSGVSFGVIEQLRKARPDAKFLELVHRLDRETSGLLMLAKRRSTLVALHQLIRDHIPEKSYLALAFQPWPHGLCSQSLHVKAPLHRFHLPNGERMVRVDPQLGIEAHSIISVQQFYQEASLCQVTLKTGRTHQIRVHLQHLGCPILGDPKYGDFTANRIFAKKGLNRMFLHAYELILPHPVSGDVLHFKAELPSDLSAFLNTLTVIEAPH